MTDQQKMKRIIILIVLAIILTVTFLFYSFPKTIEEEYSAIQFFEKEPNSAEQIAMKIAGKLENPVIGQPQFTGQLILEGYDFTKDYELLPIVLHEFTESSWLGSVVYSAIHNGKPVLRSFALITSHEFDRFVLSGYDDQSQDGQLLQIVSPAMDYQTALEILAQFRQEEPTDLE